MDRSTLPIVVLLVPFFVPGCHRTDKRLESTIAALEKTTVESGPERDAHDRILAGLKALRGKPLAGPVVLSAVRIKRPGARAATLVVDYVDTSHRVEFLRFCAGEAECIDLPEPESQREQNEGQPKSLILYTVGFSFDVNDLPTFWNKHNVTVEIHDRGGAISRRFPVSFAKLAQSRPG